MECVKNILDSVGQGECKDCICDIIPHLCQEKMMEPHNQGNTQVENDSQLRKAGMNFASCLKGA